jgi:hypothetical protein
MIICFKSGRASRGGRCHDEEGVDPAFSCGLTEREKWTEDLDQFPAGMLRNGLPYDDERF